MRLEICRYYVTITGRIVYISSKQLVSDSEYFTGKFIKENEINNYRFEGKEFYWHPNGRILPSFQIHLNEDIISEYNKLSKLLFT